jgi:hypothetical protein
MQKNSRLIAAQSTSMEPIYQHRKGITVSFATQSALPTKGTHHRHPPQASTVEPDKPPVFYGLHYAPLPL